MASVRTVQVDRLFRPGGLDLLHDGPQANVHPVALHGSRQDLGGIGVLALQEVLFLLDEGDPAAGHVRAEPQGELHAEPLGEGAVRDDDLDAVDGAQAAAVGADLEGNEFKNVQIYLSQQKLKFANFG